MKFTTKSIVIGASLSLVLAFAFVPQIFAQGGDSGGSTTTNPPESPTEQTNPTEPSSGTSTDSNQRTQTGPRTEDSSKKIGMIDREDNPNGELRKEVRREKLDDKKKALCETRQTIVNKSMGDVVTRSQSHFDRITDVYNKATKFYSEKGLTVSNYAALVAKVEAAKTAASTADTNLAAAPKLSCGSDGPKADMQAFRNKRLDKVEALGAYRDAVKALVKAVRDAAKTTEAATDATTEGKK